MADAAQNEELFQKVKDAGLPASVALGTSLQSFRNLLLAFQGVWGPDDVDRETYLWLITVAQVCEAAMEFTRKSTLEFFQAQEEKGRPPQRVIKDLAQKIGVDLSGAVDDAPKQ